MRVGYLIQDFPPEVGAGPARALEMSRYWNAHGARVTVITGMPNRRLPGQSDGQIDSRYRGHLFLEEKWDGVETMRSWLFASQRRSIVNTVINNATFAATSLAHAIIKHPEFDVLVASSPPFLPLLSAVTLAGVRGTPLVIELRDLWPDYMLQMGMIGPGILSSLLMGLEAWILSRAARVVVVTESFCARVVDKGVDRDRIDVIPNGVDLDAYTNRAEPAPLPTLERRNGDFIVGYLGTFGRGQALSVVAEAAAVVARLDPSVRFVLAGDGPDSSAVRETIERLRLANLTLSPPIPKHQTRAFYNACDTCLVPLAPIPIFQETIPSKIFEVMACERPVLGSLSGEAAEIIEKSTGGLTVPPGDARALADAVLRMKRLSNDERREMGVRGRAYVANHFDRARLSERYLRLLRDVSTNP